MTYENGRRYKVRTGGTRYEVWTTYNNGTFLLDGGGCVSMDYGAEICEIGG